MGVNVQRATSVVEMTGPAAPPMPATPAEGPPSPAELQRMTAAQTAMERDRRRLCAEMFDD